ncbi:predicted protein [Nematostella vectensis]|uniref:G-protein coupled receptors family 1 profile domain-containing protein n=1 Tax=Nematostella vectensis TaxID=45351 RepID=A7SH46_NEMVE|nr:predicted protein [Nematostella vectensis]|eukprot:XP_001629048.1 predicted protein [Nematostella vectensis]
MQGADSGNDSCFPFTEYISYSTELLPSTNILSMLLLLTVVPGAILNSLILATIWRVKPLQTPSNLFLCNLAISDLAVCVIAQPLALAWRWSEMNNSSYDIVCPLAVITSLASSQFAGVSLVTVTVASVDRYLALYLHLMYTSSVTTRRVGIVCAFTWFASTFVVFMAFAGRSTYNALCSALLPICILTVAFSFFKIVKVLMRHHTQIAAQSMSSNSSQSDMVSNLTRYRKSIAGLSTILLLLFVCYFPFIVVMIVWEILGTTTTTL